MNKRIISMFLALAMCLGISVPAFAAEPSTDSLQAMLDDKNLFTKVLILEEPVVIEGEIVGTHSVYQYFPITIQRGIANTCYVTNQYNSNHNTSYVRLTGLFWFDGETVSCIDTDISYTVSNYHQLSLKTSGNGTSKSTVTLRFEFSLTASGSVTVWCDKNGRTS